MTEKNERKQSNVKEIRMMHKGNLELRADENEETESRTIAGYAIKFGQQTEPFRDRWYDLIVEEFAPGSFDETLLNMEQKSLWNHKAEYPLGSTKSGTLRLKADAIGLNFENDLPNNSWGNDALESIKRRDVDGVSFGFICLDDKWSKITVDEQEVYKRTVTKAELYEISPVTFPAYESSEVKVRGLEEFKKQLEAEKTVLKNNEEEKRNLEKEFLELLNI